ncbi:MAG: hypothetical protein KDK70_24560, partial [Myxococcales bacterium]|nr:hypothetical protein [Myxococcales bacterium]
LPASAPAPARMPEPKAESPERDVRSWEQERSKERGAPLELSDYDEETAGLGYEDADQLERFERFEQLEPYGSLEQPEPDDRTRAPAPPKGGRGAPLATWGTLPGRIVLDHEGRLVVEVVLSRALDWRPPSTLVLLAADGGRTTVALAAGTTAAASMQPGMVLRLVFALPPDAGVPQALELWVDGRSLIIDPLG